MMSGKTTFVIVGGGLAGAWGVEALRDNHFDGNIVLFGAEEHLPYDRIPLSKEFLAPKTSQLARAYAEADQRLALSDFTLHDPDWYRQHDVDLRPGVRAVSVDPTAHTVTLADATTMRYDKLLLTTGSRSRRPSIPGVDVGAVHYLRTYDDAVSLDTVLTQGSSLAVVGGGWMEYVGYAPTYQRVVFRGDVAAREFVAFWLDGRHCVLAGMNVNIWGVVDDFKNLIRARTPVDPDRLGDPCRPLDDLLPR